MSESTSDRTAVVRVYDKTELVPFCRSLAELGYVILSTGGTAAALREAGVEVELVETRSGFPEMLDGRVKTLHPVLHAGILADRSNPDHARQLDEAGIRPIDLVCVNLYPFEQQVEDASTEAEDAIEFIDIGGPTLLRAAAKNHAHVGVVTNPAQYDRVIADLQANDGALSAEQRHQLAAAAFSRTAAYDSAIAGWMSGQHPDLFPATLRLTYQHGLDLRYGENPHQRAVLYADAASPEPHFVRARQYSGKPLSYNNVKDGAAAWNAVRDLAERFEDRVGAVVVKHNNPCGLAVADDVMTSIRRAFSGDRLAAYGGILACSGRMTISEAEELAAWDAFFEVVVLNDFEPGVPERLAQRWKNVRVLRVGGLRRRATRETEYTGLPGGMLAQDRDLALPDPGTWEHAAGPDFDAAHRSTAMATWVAAKHLWSNAVAIGADDTLIGAGMGQVDRLTSCRLAVERAGDRLRQVAYPIAASDGFFPFDDGPRLLIEAGVRCILHPGGSRRDEDTFRACDEAGVTCLVTNVRHFRH